MSILKILRLFRLILVILVSLVSLSLLPSNGYSDDWVLVENYKDFSDYYKPSSLKINKQEKTIRVLVKYLYTEKGRMELLKNFEGKGNDRQKYTDINYSTFLFILNYNENKWCMIYTIHYSKLNKILWAGEDTYEWNDISSGSVVQSLLNNIMDKYNIKS